MKTHIKISVVVAARPNFMKAAPLLQELDKSEDDIAYELVHTGQHYDYEMNQQFFDQLGIPKPDICLEVGSGSHAYQTGTILIEFEKYLIKSKPDWVIVFGDVNSTFACALAAKKLQIKVAHVEAGLRSFDEEMPEEINRILTDSISDRLYTPSRDGDENLIKEGVSPDKIKFVGNIMIDTLLSHIDDIKQNSYFREFGLASGQYILVTLHRPSNVDNKAVLSQILDALSEISKQYTVLFSIHPRTRTKLNAFGLSEYITEDGIQDYQINGISPQSYFNMISLTMNAALVLTDSGGVQEETSVLGVPCLTLRENTERPVTITEGTNRLVAQNKTAILDAFYDAKDASREKRSPELWDGKTAKRIVEDLKTL